MSTRMALYLGSTSAYECPKCYSQIEVNSTLESTDMKNCKTKTYVYCRVCHYEKIIEDISDEELNPLLLWLKKNMQEW